MVLDSHWLPAFCKWLFTLLKLIGYEIDYMNNNDFKYFNLNTQDFEKYYIKNSIIFPHNVFIGKNKINFDEMKVVFTIFETIYTKHHLEHMNYKIPNHFLNFKKSILSYLRK